MAWRSSPDRCVERIQHLLQKFVKLFLMASFRFGPNSLFHRWRRVGWFTDFVVAMGVLFILAVVSGVLDLNWRNAPDQRGFGVAIDGDSIRLGGDQIRLEGIDAPEHAQACRDAAGRSYDCGRVSRRFLSGLLAKRELRCLVSGQDRYKRSLARCFAGDEEINATLVRMGHAIAFGRYESEEDEAKSSKRGIWAGSFERPADYRRAHPHVSAPP